MGRLSYSASDEWGMIYMFRRGYKIVTSNMDEASNDWIARCWYADKSGNVFLNYKKGRKLQIEINSEINFCSDDSPLPMREEIENMSQRKTELRKVCSGIEKKVYKGLNLRR